MEKRRIDIDPEEDFIKADKAFDAFLKFMLGVSVSSIAAIALQALGVTELGWYIGASAICIPSTYAGMTVLKNRIDRKFKLDMYRADQLMKSLYEIGTYDKTIEKGKNFFWNEIELCSKKRGVALNTQDKNTINQLLFMINENYYDEINKTMNITRDELVGKVIDVAIYYIENNGSNLDDKAIDEIIGALFFVDEDMKKSMSNEFKSGKCIMDKQVDYRIVSKNVDSNNVLMADFSKLSNKERIPFFDYDDSKEYQYIIDGLIKGDYFKNYGNPSDINFDLDLLRGIISMIIVEFDEQLKEDRDDYTPIDLATSYIYNLILYCLLNKKDEFGPYEMVNVFKNWNMLSFNLRLSIVNRIFDKYGLDVERHPFGVKNVSKDDASKKILTFPGIDQNTNKF